jgi:hypothetical protein
MIIAEYDNGIAQEKGAGMTSRELHSFDWTWNALRRAVSNNDGYPVSAGRVAVEMSCSRNHAAKMLEKLIVTGQACRVTWQRGRVQTRVYNITPKAGE